MVTLVYTSINEVSEVVIPNKEAPQLLEQWVNGSIKEGDTIQIFQKGELKSEVKFVGRKWRNVLNGGWLEVAGE